MPREHQHNIDQTVDRQSQQKYGFYSVESKLLQVPTQGAVYLNVEFTECEIGKLNQMKSW